MTTLNRNPGVKIIESNTPSVGAAGMSGLVPLLVGNFIKSNGAEGKVADGVFYLQNFAEFAAQFIASPLTFTLAEAWGSERPTGGGGDVDDGTGGGKTKKATKKAEAAEAEAEVEAGEAETKVDAKGAVINAASQVSLPGEDNKTALTSEHLNTSAAAMASYFSNGGGACYVVCFGASDTAETLLTAVGELDEVSLYAGFDTASAKALVDNFVTLQKNNPTSFLVNFVEYSGGTTVPNKPLNENAYVATYSPALQFDKPLNKVDERAVFLTGTNKTLAALSASADEAENKKYQQVKTYLAQGALDFTAVAKPTFSPVGAVVGSYCATERERGIWKAPANKSLVGVVPAYNMSSLEHGNLNTASINALIWKPATGTKIMGARTTVPEATPLWRYVPVRLLFNTVERDVSAMLAPIVFQPNSAPTWQAVVAGISNYLYGIWKRGGLFGNSPEEAYRVQIALQDGDIDNGILRVRVSLAALRPVEFIDLEFTQELLVAA